MTTLEDRLHRALVGTDRPLSPDLFDRVTGGIVEDRRRRRTRHRWIAAWLLIVVGVVATVLTLTPRTASGGLDMPWWTVELAVTGGLIAIALWLGPLIKRYGRAYAADVFHDNPLTGKSYIVLSDIVYYLIFGAYILLTSHAAPEDGWEVFSGMANGELVNWELRRVGGIVLIIGVLHGINLVLMPALGRLFSLNRRLPDS